MPCDKDDYTDLDDLDSDEFLDDDYDEFDEGAEEIIDYEERSYP